MKTITALFLLMLPLAALSQSATTDNLTWSAISFHDSSTDVDASLNCQFETGPQSIRWIQKGGARVYEFTVTGTQGNWSNIGQDGEATFSVTFTGYSGWIKIRRASGMITLETFIEKEGANMLPYIFSVSTVSTR